MNPNIPYPTLASVAEALRAGYDLSPVLRSFLTYLNAVPISEAIQTEPVVLSGMRPKGAYYDAYLAAIAEHLAVQSGIPAPPWAFAPGRVLHPEPEPLPRFAALHQVLKDETPPAFRRHGLVISSNALNVA